MTMTANVTMNSTLVPGGVALGPAALARLARAASDVYSMNREWI